MELNENILPETADKNGVYIPLVANIFVDVNHQKSLQIYTILYYLLV